MSSEKQKNAVKIANLARALKEAGGETTWRKYKSNHMRKVVLKFLNLSPAERDSYECKNGFDEIAKNLISAGSKGKEGQVHIQVWKEVKDTLGEKSSAVKAREQEAAEKKRQSNGSIIVDMPQPLSADSLADPDLNEN